MITVEAAEDVQAFANFTLENASGAAPAAPASPPAPVVPGASQVPAAVTPASPPAPVPSTGGRVFASPLARTLARDASVDISILPSQGFASGPNGRVIAEDVRAAITAGVKVQPVSAAPPVSPAPLVSTASPATATVPQPTQSAPPAVPSGGSLQELYTLSKRTVPHYFLSIEVNLSKIQALRKQLGSDGEALTVQDFLIKSAAKAMAKVPEANAAWMDTFVRKYDQVCPVPPCALLTLSLSFFLLCPSGRH
jgi:pyruvate dehydrogenase E2 component (dihydrolipoamide acetyltransferase)